MVQGEEQCDDGPGNGDTKACSSKCQHNCQEVGQILDSKTGHCYWLGWEKMNAYEARLVCQQHGPGFDLAALSTLTEYNFATTMVPYTYGAWLGGSDRVAENKFKWLNGEPWTYLNFKPPWNPYEPDNYLDSEDCLFFWSDSGMGDVSCDLGRFTPLCERGSLADGLCRDGVVTGTEQCDDGNLDDLDGCTRSCRLGGCGNGTKEAEEDCDDGNEIETDACTNACRAPAYGDGLVQPSIGEECDDSNWGSQDACTILGKKARCGDGETQAINGEACDDGNLSNGDGCSATCFKE